MRNKKALSPLVATILLVAFALVIGTATMSWGRNYVSEEDIDTKGRLECFDKSLVDNELKDLQLEYIVGEITLDQYIEKQQPIVEKLKNS